MTEPPNPTIRETIQETIALLKQQIPTVDYNLIAQLEWNLGWWNDIYTTEILEDPHYDTQAITLAIKILRDILETHQEEG